MEYSVDSISNNCYEGTTCLINKINIQDEAKLAELEAMITLAKTSELELATLKDSFNEDDYRAIHRQLFDTLYDWAGEYRTIDISKKGTAFAGKNDIPELLTNCLKRLKSMDYFRGLSFDDFIEELVDIYCTTKTSRTTWQSVSRHTRRAKNNTCHRHQNRSVKGGFAITQNQSG